MSIFMNFICELMSKRVIKKQNKPWQSGHSHLSVVIFLYFLRTPVSQYQQKHVSHKLNLMTNGPKGLPTYSCCNFASSEPQPIKKNSYQISLQSKVVKLCKVHSLHTSHNLMFKQFYFPY